MSNMNIYDLMQEAFEEKDSIEMFYEKWCKMCDKAKRILSGDFQHQKATAEFLEKQTEFIRLTKESYQNSLQQNMVNG